jgi:hypothetical protein
MSSKKQTITLIGPILPGSLSTATSQCGQSYCICHRDPAKLHGPYYRWTGVIDGKRTTKTITKEQYEECKRRIKKYRLFQKKLDRLLAQSIEEAPWLAAEKVN